MSRTFRNATHKKRFLKTKSKSRPEGDFYWGDYSKCWVYWPHWKSIRDKKVNRWTKFAKGMERRARRANENRMISKIRKDIENSDEVLNHNNVLRVWWD